MVTQYLVVSLDYKVSVVVGVFATIQEAEQYIDQFGNNHYRSNGYQIVKVLIGPDGKILPEGDPAYTNNYMEDEEPSWLDSYMKNHYGEEQ